MADLGQVNGNFFRVNMSPFLRVLVGLHLFPAAIASPSCLGPDAIPLAA